MSHHEKSENVVPIIIRSPRQGAIKSTLFSGIILAYWDNVMGPLITKVWKGNDKVEIHQDIISYISNHTLSGELCRQTEINTIDPKLYVLSDLGYIFYAVIFNGHSKMGPTISSLSFVMSHADMERYLLLQDYISQQVKMMVLKYRVLQQKDLRTAVRLFTPNLKLFVSTIDSLQKLNVPSNICISNTVFSETDEANDSKLLDSKFLMRALTSHLQTCSCTIVFGTSVDKINLFIRTLCLFMPSSERYCSRYAAEENNHSFSRGLWVQGILKEPTKGLSSISSKDILLNTHPVTLIDIDEKTVCQTSPLNEHGITRKEFLKIELALLLQGAEAPVYPFHGLFTQEFGDISILVQHFITELFAIPNTCAIRKNHIENFIAVLKQKATALLSYVETKSNGGKHFLDFSKLQQLKQDLLLSSESDFRLVLAVAEKIRPGLAVFLVGDLYKNDETVQRQFTVWR